MDDIKIWRYVIPRTKDCDGGVFILDSTGFFAAVTSYGNYAYRWHCTGKEDFREFIVSCTETSYLLDKLVGRSNKEYDAEATLENVKEEIINLRRQEELTKIEAREEWNILDIYDDLRDEFSFREWEEITRLSDVWENIVNSYNEDDLYFANHLMPRLIGKIKEELEEEKK